MSNLAWRRRRRKGDWRAMRLRWNEAHGWLGVSDACPSCGSGAPSCIEIDPATGQNYQCVEVCRGPWALSTCPPCTEKMESAT